MSKHSLLDGNDSLLLKPTTKESIILCCVWHLPALLLSVILVEIPKAVVENAHDLLLYILAKPLPNNTDVK